MIKTKIDNNIGGLIFIDAPGGTGKTFLLNFILSYVRKQQRIAIATASSPVKRLISALSSGKFWRIINKSVHYRKPSAKRREIVLV